MTSDEESIRAEDFAGAMADGRLLMLESCLGFGECRVWLADPVTGAVQRVAQPQPDGPSTRIRSASVSPDGRRVAVLADVDSLPSLQLFDPATGASQVVALPDAEPRRVRWLSDGRLLIDSGSDQPRRYLVLTLPPDGRTVAT